MRKDPTVIISLVVFLGAWILSLIWGMPTTITDDDPTRFHVLFWIMFACAIRATILWFQTLFHSVRNKTTLMKIFWFLAHIAAAYILPYVYYFVVRYRERNQTTQQHVGPVSTESAPSASPDEPST